MKRCSFLIHALGTVITFLWSLFLTRTHVFRNVDRDRDAQRAKNSWCKFQFLDVNFFADGLLLCKEDLKKDGLI